jgi:hypothetical protein
MIPAGVARPKACVAWSTSPSSEPPPTSAVLYDRGAVLRVDADRAQAREVDHQAVVDAAEAGAVVAAAADRRVEALLAAEVDRRDHVGDVDAARDQRGTLVDHPVVEGPRVVVVGIAGADHRAA